MIEPIFVILGILASVAIPRLAATREDAEISAAVANLRTLVSDAGAYYVAKSSFTGAKWNDITNVPLKAAAGAAIGNTLATQSAYLKIGEINDCITVQLVNKAGDVPAHIKIIPKAAQAQTGGRGKQQTQAANNVATGVCKQVLDSKPVQAYINSTVPNGTQTINNAMAIGSNTKIY